MPGPLHGVRIIDLSAVVAGPLTTALLADQGAEVIKVERVGSGDIQRNVGSSRRGFSGNFHVLNRGKRSLALDITTPRGRGIVAALAARSDAFVHNFRPGVCPRLGLGYDDLRRHNPRLIYLSICGFGTTGPRARDRAYDPIIQAHSGLAWVQGGGGRGETEEPQQVNQLVVDKITAYMASQALTAALFAREQSGEGQEISLSMLDAAITFLWPDAGADEILQGEGIEHRPPIGAAGHLTAYRDGWATTMTLSDDEFAGLCRVHGLDELAADERFNTVAERQRHRPEYKEVLSSVVARASRELSVDEARARFREAGVPFGVAHTLQELPTDPQAQANAIFVESRHPVAGALRETRPAPVFHRTPAQPGGPAPRLGQDTRAILTELGMEDEIDELVEAGIVGLAAESG